MEIYCDGACSGNPGRGGWGYVVFENDIMIASGCGYEEYTTNNRMELMAVISALNGFDNATIVVDSQYVFNGITKWMKKWQSNGWKTADGEVKNRDLWNELVCLTEQRALEWRWQRGHNNTAHDEADKVAREVIAQS